MFVQEIATLVIPFAGLVISLAVKVQEFDLVCNMLIVAVEEHYKDAGQLLLICIKETVMHYGCI
jgi:hypothetical protein